MKKSLLPHLLLILLLTLITPVYASVELKATIGQEIDVTFDFRNMNSTIYGVIRDELERDETKIPETIRENLAERNLTDVEYRWEPVYSNDAEKSVTVRFLLWGSDVLNFTYSRETMRRTCRVRTDWRKFELNFSDDFSLSFTEYFGKPVSDWDFENENYPTYYYNYTDAVPFDPVCYFILPKEATEIHIAEDMETIVFELPPSLGESLLNSPFLILGAIIVANIVAFLYRRIRKSEGQGLES